MQYHTDISNGAVHGDTAGLGKGSLASTSSANHKGKSHCVCSQESRNKTCYVISSFRATNFLFALKRMLYGFYECLSELDLCLMVTV
jgi:hypothetical protein